MDKYRQTAIRVCKEKNTRQLRARAGMQKMTLFVKGALKTKWLQVFDGRVIWQLMGQPMYDRTWK